MDKIVLKCNCGNFLPEGAEQCEWCEYPDPPIYKVVRYKDINVTNLYYIGNYNNGIVMEHQDIVIYAPSLESAKAILKDYKKGKKSWVSI